MACPPITPCSQGDVQPYPDCVTTDPTIDPPALPDCKTSEADGDTYCPLPGSPCELKVSTQEKGCPGSIDPPVDCAAVKFASEEAANAAGCGPSTDPPTPSGIRVCETDKATGDRSCRTLNQGEFGCFETEAGPWICIDPPPVDPPPLCETDASSKPERCDGPAEGGGCFTTADGNRACYDKVVPVVVPHPKPTDGHPKEPKGRPQPKPENRSAGHADKTVKGKPKSGGDRSGKDKPKAANGKKGKRKKGKSRKAKAKAKSKRAASKPSR